MFVNFVVLVVVVLAVVNAGKCEVCAVVDWTGLVQMEQSLFHLRDDWIKLDRSNANEIHEVIFATKQLNLDVLEKTLLEISNPLDKGKLRRMS